MYAAFSSRHEKKAAHAAFAVSLLISYLLGPELGSWSTPFNLRFSARGRKGGNPNAGGDVSIPPRGSR